MIAGKINLERAIEFVERWGEPHEITRLRQLLFGELPSSTAMEALLATQREDGGWAAFWAKDYSSLDATCFRLSKAEALGVDLSNDAVHRAGRFLENRQSPDGVWEEDKAYTSNAPPWVQPGDLKARLYLTANCGYWVAFLQYKSQSQGQHRGVQAAADYLESYLSETGWLPSYLHSHWLAGGLWLFLARPEPAGKVFNYLVHRVDEMTASGLAWLITALSLAGVSTTEPLISKATERLAGLQREDGRWRSDEDPNSDVRTTLESLRAFSLTGQI